MTTNDHCAGRNTDTGKSEYPGHAAIDADNVIESEKTLLRRLSRPSTNGSGEDDFIGLALSGDGIRSTTFNLGVLQALAKLNLLKEVDCLSTVFGGGYIGVWLSALIVRNRKARVPGLDDRIAACREEVSRLLKTRNSAAVADLADITSRLQELNRTLEGLIAERDIASFQSLQAISPRWLSSRARKSQDRYIFCAPTAII